MQRKTVADFPELVAQWDWDRNLDTKPEDVRYASNKKLHWRCPVAPDHRWEAIVCNRTCHGHGCPICSGKKVVHSNCVGVTDPEPICMWHPSKNGSLTPYQVTRGSQKAVWWKCPKGPDHEWKARIADVAIHKQGCAVCRGLKVVPSTCLATTHPELSEEWHVGMNGLLTPYTITAGSKKMVWWQCKKNPDHVWQTRPHHRTCPNALSGCPHCRRSKGEEAVAATLHQMGIPFKKEVRFKSCKRKRPLPFDFAIWPKGKQVGLIEYQGVQHYQPIGDLGGNETFKQMQDSDNLKRAWVDAKGVKLLAIHYKDIKRIPKLIDDFVKTLPDRIAG